jgi:hypothetical protein
MHSQLLPFTHQSQCLLEECKIDVDPRGGAWRLAKLQELIAGLNTFFSGINKFN